MVGLTGSALAQGGTHLFFPGTGVVNAQSGTFQNLQVGPGAISITGSPSGGSTITGIQNINGQVWATSFPGADIGVKVNNAITALEPSGGVIHIPPGQYPFTTTIQCPLTSDAPFIIQGDGQTNMADSNPDQFLHGTRLNYTGNGDAVNQTLDANHQNYTGCQLRDLTLDGSGSGPNSVGWRFGGTDGSSSDHLTVGIFNRAGIEIDNQNLPIPGTGAWQWTERYNFRSTRLYRNNGPGIYFHATGTDQSYGHGYVDIWVNQNVAVKIDGSGGVYDSHFHINGNMEDATPSVFQLGDNVHEFAELLEDWVEPDAECNASTMPCYLYDVGAGAIVGADMVGGASSNNWAPNFQNRVWPASGGLAAGQLVTSILQASGPNSGISTTGGMAMDRQGCTQPAPTVSNGVIGGCGSFGGIFNVTAPVTLTFRNPFQSKVDCVLTDGGQPFLWSFAYPSGGDERSQVIFNCNQLSGAACPPGQYVAYHCAAEGMP